MPNSLSIQDAKTKQVVSQLEKPIRHLSSGEFKFGNFKLVTNCYWFRNRVGYNHINCNRICLRL